MADAAVPNDGGHRPVDVLNPSGRCRRALAAASSLLVLLGCDPSPPGTASAPDSADAAARVAPLVAALVARSGDGEASRPDVPAWPRDLAFRTDARAESVTLDAVLEDERGERHVLVRRLDRLAVRGASDPAPADADDFAFRDVLRASGAITGSGANGEAPSTRRRDALERVTLGLAEADGRTLRVRDVTLALSAPPETAAPLGDEASAGPCRATWTLSEGDGSTLRFHQERCPSGALAGDLALATSPTLAVEGTLVVDGEPREASGRGWMRRVWGELPTGGGAVVFDRLLVELDGVGLVEATRSKRRSGRGPRITTASLRAPSADEVPLRADWQDGRAAPGAAGTDTSEAGATGEAGAGVPGGWTLRSADAGIDVVLEPILDVPLTDDVLGTVWRGGVVASGTHTGTGFVEFLPLERRADDELADPDA